MPRCDAGSFGDLTPLLAPRSVAVVGASDREGNLGGLAVRFLQQVRLSRAGLAGECRPAPLSPDCRAFRNLRALPSPPDLAIVAVPAASVPAVIQDCIAAGVPAAVVWAGGFAEGDDAGRARQRELEDGLPRRRHQAVRPELHRRHQHVDRPDRFVQLADDRDRRA